MYCKKNGSLPAAVISKWQNPATKRMDHVYRRKINFDCVVSILLQYKYCIEFIC